MSEREYGMRDLLTTNVATYVYILGRSTCRERRWSPSRLYSGILGYLGWMLTSEVGYCAPTSTSDWRRYLAVGKAWPHLPRYDLGASTLWGGNVWN